MLEPRAKRTQQSAKLMKEKKKGFVIFGEYDDKCKYIMTLSPQILLQQFLWPMIQGLQKNKITR